MKNRQAQIINEYAVLIAMVVMVIVAMTAITKRTLQGRIKDAKSYAMKLANDAYVLTRDPAAQTPARIVNAYEPYYQDVRSEVTRDSKEQLNMYNDWWAGVRFQKTYDDTTKAQSNSLQLPPKDAR